MRILANCAVLITIISSYSTGIARADDDADNYAKVIKYMSDDKQNNSFIKITYLGPQTTARPSVILCADSDKISNEDTIPSRKDKHRMASETFAIRGTVGKQVMKDIITLLPHEKYAKYKTIPGQSAISVCIGAKNEKNIMISEFYVDADATKYFYTAVFSKVPAKSDIRIAFNKNYGDEFIK